MKQAFQVVAFATMMGVLTPLNSSGQVATPSGDRDVPQPEECQVEPRTAESFERLLQEGVATPEAGPTASPGAYVAALATGPVDAEVRDAITATARETIACYNAADIQRYYSLLSDAYLRESAVADPIGVGELLTVIVQRGAATPVPVPETARIELLRIRDFESLEDGRVAATIETNIPMFSSDGATADRIVFAPNNGRYLIDGEITGDLGVIAATPIG